jgi:hypothetical protein
LHPAPERFDHGVVVTAPSEPIEASRPESIARRVNAQDVNCPGSTSRRNTVLFARE